jgi:HSP20 family protein
MGEFIPWSSFGYRWHSILGVTKRWRPSIDVFRRDGAIVVKMDLPGIDLEDIDLSIEADTLIIRGYRRISQEDSGDYCQSPERPTGSFYRTIQLPEGALVDVVETTYEDGVLEVIIPIT